jgi:hypothetical protein
MQKILVIFIVLFAAFFLFRKAKLAFRGKGGCSSGCGCKDKTPES